MISRAVTEVQILIITWATEINRAETSVHILINSTNYLGTYCHIVNRDTMTYVWGMADNGTP